MPVIAALSGRYLRRYRQIGEVLIKYGFGVLLDQLDLSHLLSLRRRVVRRNQVSGSRGARLRAALVELGPTFIKFGQLLSTRRDLLPPDIIGELKALQDDVPGVEFESIKEVLENELRRPLEEVFSSFEETPFAAASIGQVHRAVLRDGSPVAVKVVRPGIRLQVNADLEILGRLARLVRERLRDFIVDPVEIVDEFSRSLRAELDLTIEAVNIERFRKNFSSNQAVHIPRVYRPFSSRDVLTVEFISGIKISDLRALAESGLDKKAIARHCARALMQMVILDGFFHADPHPGNIIVERDGKIAFVDFGMVGRLDEEKMAQVAELFISIVGNNPFAMAQALIRIGSVEDEVDKRALEADLRDLVGKYHGLPLQKLNVGPILMESFDVTRRHHIRVPREFFLLAKAVFTIEEVVKDLDPDLNIVEMGKPFASRLIAERYDPQRLILGIARDATEQLQHLAGLPGVLDTVLHKTAAGKLEIIFRHRGLEQLITRLDIISNRLALAMILAALIVSSSLIIQLRTGPTFVGLPLLGLIGYGFAAIIGLWLIVSILRSGRL